MGGKLQLVKHIDLKINFWEKLNDNLSQDFFSLRKYYLSLPKSQEKSKVRKEYREILDIQKIVLQEWEKVIKIKQSLLQEQAYLNSIYNN
jgi:hypothetical protein